MTTWLLMVIPLLAVIPVIAQPDPFGTPEAALDTYIAALRSGDRAAVEECFDPGRGFNLPTPLAVEHYAVRRRVVLGPKDVGDWGSKPLQERARAGDVRLDVRQVTAGKAEMYSYWLRNEGAGWRIYSLSAWGDP